MEKQIRKIKNKINKYCNKFKNVVGCGSCNCLPIGHQAPCGIWKKVLIVGAASFITGAIVV
tara:strand:- start:577 stop:759 length:183 start_codon:yes stop_codon:yes gene_type:complete